MAPLNIPNLELSSLTLEEKVWLTRVMAEILAGHDAVNSRSRAGFQQTLGSFENREQAGNLLEMLEQRPLPPWPGLKTERARALTLLHHLATVMTADHVVSRKQVILFRKAVAALGLSKLYQSLLLRHVRDIINAGKPDAAILTANNFVRTTLRDFSDSHCSFRFHRPLVPGVFLMVRMRTIAPGESYHAPIHATVHAVTKDPLETGDYLIRAEYQQRLGPLHGLQELINPDSPQHGAIPGYGVIDPGHHSLIGRHVGCPACGENGLLFWRLRPNTVHCSENLFGVPLYHAPFPGYDFCDFNRLHVTVCPRCFFASAREQDFLRVPDENMHFDAHSFNKLWESQNPRLKQELHNFPQSFGKVNRKPEHAVHAFEIAVETMRTLLRLEENEHVLWEIVSLRMIQAEMSMQLKRRDEARNQLQDALGLLNSRDTRFSNEREVQALLLRFLLLTYFRRSSAAGISFQQLRDLKHKSKAGTLYSVILQDSLKKAKWVASLRQRLNDEVLDDFSIPGFPGEQGRDSEKKE